ncbi:MAG: MarR family transcriptional regulator [Lachnospiraceae bacterium]|nr:MarR family transcriptional regulator [Lachnospiraceae bacterium]
MERLEEQEVLGFKMRRVVDEVERMANQAVAPQGLTFAQGRIILYICEHEGKCSQSEIENILDTSHQAVSGILSRMKDKGLLDYAFDGTDRRVKNVYMTPKGEGLYDGLVAVRHEYDRRMEHVLSPEERVKLFELLDRVFEHLHDEI